MHNAAYDDIKPVSSANKVLIGGLASVRQQKPGPRRGIPPLRFTRELACVDRKLRRLRRRACRGFQPLRADGFALHPYSLNDPPGQSDNRHPDSARLADVGRVITLLKQLHERGRLANPLPVYLTEYGYETNPPDPGGVSESAQAIYLSEATYLAWRHAEVRSFPQFLLRDIGPDERYGVRSPRRWSDFQTGLYHHGGEAKPAVTTFKLPFWAEAARTPDGARTILFFGQVRPDAGAEKVTVQKLLPNGVWVPVTTLPVLASSKGGGCPRFATDRYGFFLRKLAYTGRYQYRALWHRQDGTVLSSAPVEVRDPRPTGPQGVMELMRPPD
jgi:hypothetical protein